MQCTGQGKVIHPTAIIDPSAKLGAGVSVGAFSIIAAEVTLGDNCWVGPHAVISGPSEFGSDNKIFQHTSIGEMPQDLKYDGEPTVLKVGDRNVFREFSTVHRGTVSGGGETIIGDDNLFMAYTHVAHDCKVGNHTVFSNAASIAGHVEVGDFAILGGFSIAHQFICIGRHAFCGLGSVITNDVTPFSTIAGNRARAVSINKEGLSRRGFSSEVIKALHKTFRVLLKSKQTREQALEELDSLIKTYSEVKEFTDFVINSKRGVIR